VCWSQVPSGQLDVLHAAVGQRDAAFKQEYGQKEPQLEIKVAAASNAASICLTAAASQRVLDLLLTLPHGVIKNSHYVAGG
jgi:dipeptidase D